MLVQIPCSFSKNMLHVNIFVLASVFKREQCEEFDLRNKEIDGIGKDIHLKGS